MNLVTFQNTSGLDTFRDLKYFLFVCLNFLATAFLFVGKPASGSVSHFAWHACRQDS